LLGKIRPKRMAAKNIPKFDWELTWNTKHDKWSSNLKSFINRIISKITIKLANRDWPLSRNVKVAGRKRKGLDFFFMTLTKGKKIKETHAWQDTGLVLVERWRAKIERTRFIFDMYSTSRLRNGSAPTKDAVLARSL